MAEGAELTESWLHSPRYTEGTPKVLEVFDGALGCDFSARSSEPFVIFLNKFEDQTKVNI